MPDYHDQIRKALARQRGADKTKTALDRVMSHMPASVLINDITELVADALRAQQKDILGHVGRLFELSQLDRDKLKEDQRFFKLHARITHLESEVRQLERGRK